MAIFKSGTKELITEIEQHKATINLALSAEELGGMLRVLSRQDDLKAGQAELKDGLREISTEIRARWAMETHISINEERAGVLAYFEKVDAAVNHRASLKLRHPMTGLWVSEGEIFRNWLFTPKSRLWLSGIPGAGKTVLAASLIEEAAKESSPARAVVYFYCDYKDAEKQNPENVMSSLASQLARQHEDAFKLLHELYKTCCPTDSLHRQPSLSELESSILYMSACFEDVTIVIDGLDECGDHIHAVASSLMTLTASDTSNIRLLILSRDLYEIRETLVASQSFTHLEIAARSEDLELYVAAEINARMKSSGRGKLRIRNPELKAHILETLVDRADGM